MTSVWTWSPGVWATNHVDVRCFGIKPLAGRHLGDTRRTFGQQALGHSDDTPLGDGYSMYTVAAFLSSRELVFTSSRPVKMRSIHVVSSWTRNHDRWTRVDMTSCLTKLTICVKMRSIGKSWTRDYQDHVISWTRLHDLNGTQHVSTKKWPP